MSLRLQLSQGAETDSNIKSKVVNTRKIEIKSIGIREISHLVGAISKQEA